MRCLECRGEAKWVDAGRDIGSYWWCVACKKEEKEWARPASPAASDGGIRRYEDYCKYKGNAADYEAYCLRTNSRPGKSIINGIYYWDDPAPPPSVVYLHPAQQYVIGPCLFCGGIDDCLPNCALHTLSNDGGPL